MTLIIGAVYTNDVWLSLWVDWALAVCQSQWLISPDREIQITPVYNEAKYARKLTDKRYVKFRLRIP